MRAATLVLLGAVAFLGCEPIETSDVPVDTTTTSPDSSATAPDNTAVNEQDASGATKTPIDQDETQRDVNITAEIRSRILNTEGMSINGRNAKVITAGGKVTLRGPVESAEERDTIDTIAREVAGEGNVDNQLKVDGEPDATTPTPTPSPTPVTPERPAPPERPTVPDTEPAPSPSPETPAPETPASETPAPATPETPAETPSAPETPAER
jgi:hypothetical protein